MTKAFVVFVLTALFLPMFVFAQTELQQNIDSVIQELQKISLETQPTKTDNFCVEFTSNMSRGDRGGAVWALHLALEKEGFSIDPEEKDNNFFGDVTASAVTGFQQKHSDEILSPVGLEYGTGAVGSYTRAKFNDLYGCDKQGGGEVLGWSTGNTEDMEGLASILQILSDILESLGEILGR